MTDTTTPAAPPPLTGQDINLAASATRRLLVAALDPFGIAFESWVFVNALGTGRVASEDELAAVLRAGLQLTDTEIEDLLASVAEAGLVDRSDGLALTPSGQDRFAAGSAVVAELVAELYAGFAPDDLARTRNILVEITARAEARLASAA